jgi:hypothetical protein
MSWNEVTDGGAWAPQIGDKLEGIVKSRQTKKGQNGEYTIFTIENTEGEEFQLWGVVLETKLGQLEDGTKVLITYKGEQRGKSGGKYKDFAVMKWEE